MIPVAIVVVVLVVVVVVVTIPFSKVLFVSFFSSLASSPSSSLTLLLFEEEDVAFVEICLLATFFSSANTRLPDRRSSIDKKRALTTRVPPKRNDRALLLFLIRSRSDPRSPAVKKRSLLLSNL